MRNRSAFRNIDMVYGYEVDSDRKYIDQDDYTDRINEIEDAVNAIQDQLEDVQGLELIDKVKDALELLADKLY